jgi:hypothetical protein
VAGHVRSPREAGGYWPGDDREGRRCIRLRGIGVAARPTGTGKCSARCGVGWPGG